MSKFIEVPVEEYNKLLKDQMFLQSLVDAGVDNWSGYYYARGLNNDDA